MSNQMFYPSNNNVRNSWKRNQAVQANFSIADKIYNLVKSQGKRITLWNLYLNLNIFFQVFKKLHF